MSANADEATPLTAEQGAATPAAAEETPADAPAASATTSTEEAPTKEKEEATKAAAAEEAKQKEKEEKERVKREKEEQKKREAEEKKREAEEKKREAEEKKRKKEEEKAAKAKAKAEAKAEAKAAASSATEHKRCPELVIDIVNRDKNQINSHINVQFEDIIAEPDPTVFSFDSVWTLSYKVFTSTKLWCYRIISLICAVPAAICWGIEFALLSFCTIWCWQPSLKAFDISLWYTRRIYEILLKVFVEPCFHAAGKCLSHIVVTVRRDV